MGLKPEFEFRRSILQTPFNLNPAVQPPPRPALGLPSTIPNCPADHLPGDNRFFRKQLRPKVGDRLAGRQSPDLGLNAAAEDSEKMVLVALRDIAEARQMARVAGEAGVSREALYRMLHKGGNPTYSSFMGILGALGLRIVFTPASLSRESAGPKPAKRPGTSRAKSAPKPG